MMLKLFGSVCRGRTWPGSSLSAARLLMSSPHVAEATSAGRETKDVLEFGSAGIRKEFVIPDRFRTRASLWKDCVSNMKG